MENVKEQHGRRFRQAWIEGYKGIIQARRSPAIFLPGRRCPAGSRKQQVQFITKHVH